MKKVTFVKSKVKSIFYVESHSRGFWKKGAPNACMNGCTLLGSGGAFSKHFPQGAKTGARFFGAKIARSSRRVQRGLGTGDWEQGLGAARARSAIGGSFEHSLVLKQDAVFTRAFLTTKVTKDTKTKHCNSCFLCVHGEFCG